MRLKDHKSIDGFCLDWIAHGILDSIVDSFFPFLENIEAEVMAIDNTIFSGELDPITPTKSPKVASVISTNRTRTNTDSQLEVKYTDNQGLEDEKSQRSPRLHFVVPHLTVSFSFNAAKRFIINAWKLCTWRTKVGSSPTLTPTPTPSQLTLQRIGSTRKLVTSLVRLIATKPDVLTAYRKQLMRSTALKHNGRSSDELAIYSGDVQG